MNPSAKNRPLPTDPIIEEILQAAGLERSRPQRPSQRYLEQVQRLRRGDAAGLR